MGLIMRQVWALRRHLPELVIPDLRPSRLHRLLEPFILEALFILAIAEEEPIPSRIMHDVQDLRRMRPAIGGEFLKTLGIPPGPIYTQVLAALRDAKLDGQVSTAEEEEEFVRARLAEILPPSSTHAGQASPR
jgi:tRNA nucleotidyltransferase (CCA-adding enzyme)